MLISFFVWLTLKFKLNARTNDSDNKFWKDASEEAVVHIEYLNESNEINHKGRHNTTNILYNDNYSFIFFYYKEQIQMLLII
jgi:hypothetical protein